MNLIGLGKYKHMFKFFGGGEVLTDERPFPHDGRNIPLLFNATVRRGDFILLGGIGAPHKRISKELYDHLLPRAKELIIRDPISIKIIEGTQEFKREKLKVHSDKIKLHEDFSFSVLRKLNLAPLRKGEKGGFVSAKIGKSILVNINTATCTSHNIHKIQLFCQQYPGYRTIYFPCDMDDDAHCFELLQEAIPGLEYYDRTKYSLQETIQVFLDSEAGIGSRLHFLLPLKFFNKPFQSIAKAEKVHKMINHQLTE